MYPYKDTPPFLQPYPKVSEGNTIFCSHILVNLNIAYHKWLITHPCLSVTSKWSKNRQNSKCKFFLNRTPTQLVIDSLGFLTFYVCEQTLRNLKTKFCIFLIRARTPCIATQKRFCFFLYPVLYLINVFRNHEMSKIKGHNFTILLSLP